MQKRLLRFAEQGLMSKNSKQMTYIAFHGAKSGLKDIDFWRQVSQAAIKQAATLSRKACVVISQ